MEEEKAAAYYEELTQKGRGAARFKQGLGFSTDTTTASAAADPPSRGSALPSSSFMSGFVKASSPTKSNLLGKQSQLHTIQNKLKKREPTSSIDRKPPSEDKIRVRDSDRDVGRHRNRSRSRERGRDKDSVSRKRSRSRSRERRGGGGGGGEERERSRRRRYRSSSRERRKDRDRRGRSRSRCCSDGERRRDRRDRDRGRGRGRSRSRSLSPRGQKSERGGGDDDGGRKGRVLKKEGNGVVDYAKLIDGYDLMTPAERVKAKMKLQLSQTAEKDEKMGSGSQWERFDFDKDAPVEDEELEAADDDAAVSKRIGQSFRFASLEGKREDVIRNAHDEAMFGVPAQQPSQTSESEEDQSENENKKPNNTDADPASSLLNEKVLSMQQGSWRDRARRNVGY